jgi:hypothetical protein
MGRIPVIKFMVLSAPRSASTWVANWLTTERTLCLHDPILEHCVEDLDALPCDRLLGIACTATALLPAFVNAHAARKIVLHRDLGEVNRSLVSIGLTPLSPTWTRALDRIEGMHVDYGDLFEPVMAAEILSYLFPDAPFDAARHAQLCGMHVEPKFEKVKIKADRARDFRRRVAAALA